MFERYTEGARRTIFFGRYEASQFGSPFIESEHILLGILREGKASLNAVLGLIDVGAIRAQIEAGSTPRPKTLVSVDLPLTDECKRIFAFAAEEAMRANQKYIGLEHLTLGILRENCLAARILGKQGLTLESARKLIAGAKEQLEAAASSRSPTPAEISAASTPAQEVPETRRPVTMRVVIKCESKILLAYRSHFGPPRIGESILIRNAEGAGESYRVQDIIWELSLDEAIVLKEVDVLVVPEKAAAKP